ncbi:MAG TPA: C40 family peptidase [Albitalea sp.]|uniref:C40 family peptidase n=1 Tax=Piscinibacter sp. TaxID=1903157 RepID=UPI002ED6AA1C
MLASLRLAPIQSALAAGLLALAAGAQAAPELPTPDTIGLFLAEKNLLPSEPIKPNLAERVRDKASDMVVTAMNFLGVRYKRGGASETSGFDCSGFTRHIFETSLGLVLPRRADEQAKAPGLIQVKADELKPGDLVFFNTLKRTFSHVGIYIGEGKFIHSPRPGGEVRVEDMGFKYWRKRFTGARRVEALPEAPAPAATPPDTAPAPSL